LSHTSSVLGRTSGDVFNFVVVDELLVAVGEEGSVRGRTKGREGKRIPEEKLT